METKPKILKDPNKLKRSSSHNSEPHNRNDSSPIQFQSLDSSPYCSPMNSINKQRPLVDNSKAIVVIDKVTGNSGQEDTDARINDVTVHERALVKEKVEPERRVSTVGSFLKKTQREELLSFVELALRVSEMIFCLISFSVMAADKTKGWSGDSFDRYKEYQYCISMNVIGFVYSGFQAYVFGHHLARGVHLIHHNHVRCYFNFFMDQALSYLLISSASSAATRVDDWQSNWGKDEFTKMTTASVTMAFLAFIAFACNSVLSASNVYSNNSP